MSAVLHSDQLTGLFCSQQKLPTSVHTRDILNLQAYMIMVLPPLFLEIYFNEAILKIRGILALWNEWFNMSTVIQRPTLMVRPWHHQVVSWKYPKAKATSASTWLHCLLSHFRSGPFLQEAFLTTKSLPKKKKKILPLKFISSAEGSTSVFCLMSFGRALLQKLTLNVHCGQMSCRLFLH